MIQWVCPWFVIVFFAQCQGTPGFLRSGCLCLESLQPELLRQVRDTGNPIVIEFQSMHIYHLYVILIYIHISYIYMCNIYIYACTIATYSNCLVLVIHIGMPCLFIGFLLDIDKLLSQIEFVPRQINLWQKRSRLLIIPPPSLTHRSTFEATVDSIRTNMDHIYIHIYIYPDNGHRLG